jgi:hypothetical protein
LGAKLKDIGKLITQALESKVVLDEGAKVLVESIPIRTRLGKGVKEAEGPTHALPNLKQKTKYNRKLLASKGELTGPGATPSKSGLNRSGDLLNSIKSIVTKGRIQVELNSNKEKQKAEHLLKIDPLYEFMNVSRAEMNRMIKAMSEKITEILNKVKFDSL